MEERTENLKTKSHALRCVVSARMRTAAASLSYSAILQCSCLWGNVGNSAARSPHAAGLGLPNISISCSQVRSVPLKLPLIRLEENSNAMGNSSGTGDA